jgi:hypothetical protein
MTATSIARFLLLLLPGLLGSGCATEALWNDSPFDESNAPASNTHLRLFLAGPQKKLLVVYDEYSERRDSVRTRACFVDDNWNRISQQQRPHFVKPDAATPLVPVPVFLTTNIPIPSPPLYAVFSTNDQAFTLYSGSRPAMKCSLPAYDDGKGKVERLALTPLAAVADLTIVGGVIAYCAVGSYAQAHDPQGWTVSIRR